MEEIKDRVARLRHAKGWTQKELAKAAGVKQQNIQQIEAGKVRSPRFLLSLAEALGVRPHWLMTGLGSPDYPPKPEPQEKIRYQVAQKQGRHLSVSEKNDIEDKYPGRSAAIAKQRQIENAIEGDQPLRLLAYRIQKLDERVQADVIGMIAKYLSDPSQNAPYLDVIETILSHAEDDLFTA